MLRRLLRRRGGLAAALLLPALLAAGGRARAEGAALQPDSRPILTLDLDKAQGLDKEPGCIPSAVSWSPDGELIAVAGHYKVVRVFNARTGEQVGWGPNPRMPIFWHLALAWTPDSRRLFSGGGDHAIWVFTRASQFHTMEKALRPIEVYTLGLDMDPTGRYLASAEKDGRVSIWDVNGPIVGGASSKSVNDQTSGPPLRASQEPPFGGHSVSMYCVAWSPDGKYLITGSAWGLKLWDGRNSTGKETTAHCGLGESVWKPHPPQGIPLLKELVAYQEPAKELSFIAVDWSPDGKWVATGEGGVREFATGSRVAEGAGALKIWDPATWTARTIDQIAPRAYAVAFFPDGTLLAAGGGEEVRVYHVGTWQKLASFGGFKDEVNSVAWSPDSTRLVACAGGEKIDKRRGTGPSPFALVFRVREAGAAAPPATLASPAPGGAEPTGPTDPYSGSSGSLLDRPTLPGRGAASPFPSAPAASAPPIEPWTGEEPAATKEPRATFEPTGPVGGGTSDPQAAKLLEQAQQAVQRGQGRAAISRCQAILKKYPNSAEAAEAQRLLEQLQGGAGTAPGGGKRK